MREIRPDAGSVLYYLHGDHLGSTSLVTLGEARHVGGGVVAPAGSVWSRRRYDPYGETRYTYGRSPTDFGFTGQREDGGTGLMYYRARYYHPALGRFVSADTIVPGVGSQVLNRYMYTLGNPLRYTDPSGHFETDAELAQYLGFDDTEQMYNSDLWAQWSQSNEWMAMVRSKEFNFGSVLVWESGNEVLQAMLLECDNELALWSWEYPKLAKLNEYSLDDIFTSERQALFYNPDPTKELEENYHPVAYRGNESASLPSPNFHYPGIGSRVWTHGVNGNVRIVVERKSDWRIGGLKIIGGSASAAKGATMMVAGFAGAPSSFGVTFLAVAPGAMAFAGGLATFSSGVRDVIGEVTGWHPELIKR